MYFSLSNIISLSDWNGYTANGNFKNFLTYYGIKLSIPEEMTEEYWENENEALAAAAKSKVLAQVAEPFANYQTTVAGAAKALNKTEPTSSSELLALYQAAVADLTDAGANKYPGGTTVTEFGKTTELSGETYWTTEPTAKATVYDPYKAVFNASNEAYFFDAYRALHTIGATTMLNLDQWLEANKKALPKYRKCDKTGSYYDAKMNGSNDPYTAANNGQGDTYIKDRPSEPILVDAANSKYDYTSPLASNSKTGVDYATAIAAYQADTCVYNSWLADCAAFENFYGISRTEVEKDNADDTTTPPTAATKHWNEYTYDAKSGNVKIGTSTQVDIDAALKKTITSGTITLTADNWGINDSEFKNYLTYVNKFNELNTAPESPAGAVSYAAAKKAWEDAGIIVGLAGTTGHEKGFEGTQKIILNYVYYMANVKDNANAQSATGNLTALKTGMESNLLNSTKDAYSEGSAAKVDAYYAKLAEAETAAATAGETYDPADEVANAISSMYLTDAGLTNRTTPTTLAALQTALAKARPMSEVAPERLKFKLLIDSDGDFIDRDGKKITGLVQDNNGVLQGKVYYEYNNNNANTNLPFNIYVPFDVTYNYLDRAPAKFIRIWAVIRVEATLGNGTTN
jgi:hypothetical protein